VPRRSIYEISDRFGRYCVGDADHLQKGRRDASDRGIGKSTALGIGAAGARGIVVAGRFKTPVDTRIGGTGATTSEIVTALGG
jgi:hypothetical protein